MFTQLNSGQFRQTTPICPLASYAIAAEYLLGGAHAVKDFFWAMGCEGVAASGESPPPEMTIEQLAWGSLFLGAVPWDLTNALEKVAWLHNNSHPRAFVDARAGFSVTWIPAPFEINASFHKFAAAERWLACVAHQKPPKPDAVHAVCVGDDGHGLFRVETSFPQGASPANPNGAERIAGWGTLGSVRLDALLMVPRATI